MDDDTPPPANPPPPPGDGWSSDGHPDRIELTVPLRSEFLSTIRTMTACLAADAGFSVDEIDDLRLALGEVVAAYLDGSGERGDRVRSTFVIGGDTLTVTVRPEHSDPHVRFDGLTAGILDAVSDDCQIDERGVTLVKRATEAAFSADTAR